MLGHVSPQDKVCCDALYKRSDETSTAPLQFGSDNLLAFVATG